MATNITESDVLSFFGLSKPPYSAEHVSTTTAIQKRDVSKDRDNFDDAEWVIYKTEGKKKTKIDPKSFTSNNTSFNACSIKGEQGIIITKKKEFIKNKHKGSQGPQSGNSSYSGDFTDGGMSSYGMGADAGAIAGWLEATDYGPKGHDENIVKRIQFAKCCLLKECYEWVGINLSSGAGGLFDTITNSDLKYWE